MDAEKISRLTNQRVVEWREDEPVLLIDDAIDSGWTLTITTALLRKAGCGIVYPATLTSTTAN